MREQLDMTSQEKVTALLLIKEQSDKLLVGEVQKQLLIQDNKQLQTVQSENTAHLTAI